MSKEYKGRPLGQILRKMGKVTRDQVHQALDIQKEKGGVIGQILTDLGYIDDKTLHMALAFQVGMDFVDLNTVEIAEDLAKLVPAQMANAYKILPISNDPQTRTLTIALASADNFHAVDDLRMLLGQNVRAVIADSEILDTMLQKLYGTTQESIFDVINDMAGDDALDRKSTRLNSSHAL